MSYIKDSKEIPFTLNDFYNNTTFTIRSKSNNYKYCNVLLEHYSCNSNNKSVITMIVTIWDGLNGYGRHVITIEELTSKIEMKSLLIEIAEKFASKTFEIEDCYIETEEKKF